MVMKYALRTKIFYPQEMSANIRIYAIVDISLMSL